jgi:hypothetical protein
MSRAITRGGDRYRLLIHLSGSLVGPDESWEAFLEDGTVLSRSWRWMDDLGSVTWADDQRSR